MLPTEPPKATYPEDRKSCGHGIRFIKALVISNAATKCGRGAVQLAIAIAATEDRFHYSKPPAFWRKQLLEVLGMTNPSQLMEARQEAIKAGLLHYQRGRKGKPGLYWTVVPDWLKPHYLKPSGGKTFGSESGSESEKCGSKSGSENNAFGSESGSESELFGSESGPYSYPSKSITPLSTHAEEPVGGVEELDGEEESQGPLRYGLDQPDEVFA